MTCAIVPRFETWPEGQRYARTRSRRSVESRGMYHCPACHGYHFGATKEDQFRARKRRSRVLVDA